MPIEVEQLAAAGPAAESQLRMQAGAAWRSAATPRGSSAMARRLARCARAAKEEHVALARERVFGPQGYLPGDREFRKKLEGRKLMRPWALLT